MSNAERQRRFQARNPGYDARRKARARASAKRDGAKLLAAILEKVATEAKREPLMLPAPVEDLAMAELNALKASLAIEDDKVMG